MLKILKLFRFNKTVKNVIKPSQTTVFAKYNTASEKTMKAVKAHTEMIKFLEDNKASSELINEAQKSFPVKYDYKSQIPAQYTSPEFKAFLSQNNFRRQKVRKLKEKELIKAQKKQESIQRLQLFDKHEEAVAKIMYMDPKYLAKTAIRDEMKKLTDPDICLELLDYDGYRVLNENKPHFETNTNNILLNKIAQSGKSIKRADMLIERFKYQFSEKEFKYPEEVKELVNAILHLSEESQSHSLFKMIKKIANPNGNFNAELNSQVLKGIMKAAKTTVVPEEFAQIPEIILNRQSQSNLTGLAAQTLACFKGKFDVLAEFMRNTKNHARDIKHSEIVISAGFKSALKDNKLAQYKEIVLNPQNNYLSYLIENNRTRTPQEENLFRKEITINLLNEKYHQILSTYDKKRLYEIFKIDTK